MSDTAEQFKGPLFLVGMPRSGTKLLRGLLNRHQGIGIPEAETLFFPYWSRHWDRYEHLSDRERFHGFYAEVTRLPYFTYMKQLSSVIPESEWFDACDTFSPSGVFEALIRHDAGIPGGEGKIWGDKSPSYLVHIPLIKAHFPAARVIHIVRDVRDFCLSSHSAWGKNMQRAAQQWADRVELARRDGRALGTDYLEIRYEDLVLGTEKQLRRICVFLGITFQRDMLSLDKPVENLGDASQEKAVIKSNVAKYSQRMSCSTIRQIEKITCNQLRALGYEVSYKGPPVRVPDIIMRLCQVLDGVNLVRFEIRDRGFAKAFQHRWKLFATSSFSG